MTKNVLGLVCIGILAFAVLTLGCTPEPPPPPQGTHIFLQFRQGQMIDLKIGGFGQIIQVENRRADQKPYKVRIQTDRGPQDRWFSEFELYIDIPRPRGDYRCAP